MAIKDEGVSKVSANVMKKARNLRVESAEEELNWWVSGGKEPHLVWADPLSEFACDCIGFMMRKICSHVLAVRLYLNREVTNE